MEIYNVYVLFVFLFIYIIWSAISIVGIIKRSRQKQDLVPYPSVTYYWVLFTNFLGGIIWITMFFTEIIRGSGEFLKFMVEFLGNLVI